MCAIDWPFVAVMLLSIAVAICLTGLPLLLTIQDFTAKNLRLLLVLLFAGILTPPAMVSRFFNGEKSFSIESICKPISPN